MRTPQEDLNAPFICNFNVVSAFSDSAAAALWCCISFTSLCWTTVHLYAVLCDLKCMFFTCKCFGRWTGPKVFKPNVWNVSVEFERVCPHLLILNVFLLHVWTHTFWPCYNIWCLHTCRCAYQCNIATSFIKKLDVWCFINENTQCMMTQWNFTRSF